MTVLSVLTPRRVTNPTTDVVTKGTAFQKLLFV